MFIALSLAGEIYKMDTPTAASTLFVLTKSPQIPGGSCGGGGGGVGGIGG